MKQELPIFGVRNDQLPQKMRVCAYAVIVNSQGRVAAVQENPGRMHLPGGGIEAAETPADAVRREVLEELGCNVHLGQCIGHALQYLETNGHCQATYSTFFAAELAERVLVSHEHELQWAAAEDFYHPSQAWAARHCQVVTADQ
jgi:8-oxo-dGTP diphosphatase